MPAFAQSTSILPYSRHPDPRIHSCTFFSSVVIRFKSVGSAPIMKQNFFKITSSHKFQAVVQFLRKELRWKPGEPLVRLSRFFSFVWLRGMTEILSVCVGSLLISIRRLRLPRMIRSPHCSRFVCVPLSIPGKRRAQPSTSHCDRSLAVLQYGWTSDSQLQVSRRVSSHTRFAY